MTWPPYQPRHRPHTPFLDGALIVAWAIIMAALAALTHHLAYALGFGLIAVGVAILMERDR